MNFLKRAWELVSPLVIYSLIQYVVVTAVIFVYIYTKADPGLMGTGAIWRKWHGHPMICWTETSC